MNTSASDWPPALVNRGWRAALLDEVEGHLARGEGFALATLNLDHVVKLRRDPDFRAAYARHSHVVADGNPVVWLLRLAGRQVELIPGSDLVVPLAATAARLDVPVALVGSTPEVLDRAAARLQADHPGLRVSCRIAPPMGYDPAGPAAADDLARVAASGARLCFLALGAPKQEILAARAAELAPGLGVVSVGAGLDFVAGQQRRAPRWVRRIAMEWLWRMLSNPLRLTGRYALCGRALPGLAWQAWRRRGTGRAT